MRDAHEYNLHNREIKKITLSIGTFFYDYSNESMKEILKHADENMYKAKEAGRDCAFLDEILKVV